MPVVTQKAIVFKALPITFQIDGTVDVTIRELLVDDGAETELSRQTVTLSKAEVDSVMQMKPLDNSKRRWDDFSEALYQLLIGKGLISGSIV